MNDKRYVPPKHFGVDDSSPNERSNQSKAVRVIVGFVLLAVALALPMIAVFAYSAYSGISNEAAGDLVYRFTRMYLEALLVAAEISVAVLLIFVARSLWNHKWLGIPLGILWLSFVVILCSGFADWFALKPLQSLLRVLDPVFILIGIASLAIASVKWLWWFARR